MIFALVLAIALLQLLAGSVDSFQVSSLKPALRTSTALNMGVKLMVNDDEPIENSLRKFKRAVNQSGHLMDLRFKEQWETAADKKKRKKEKARLLNRIERTNDRYENRAFGGTEYNS